MSSKGEKRDDRRKDLWTFTKSCSCPCHCVQIHEVKHCRLQQPLLERDSVTVVDKVLRGKSGKKPHIVLLCTQCCGCGHHTLFVAEYGGNGRTVLSGFYNCATVDIECFYPKPGATMEHFWTIHGQVWPADSSDVSDDSSSPPSTAKICKDYAEMLYHELWNAWETDKSSRTKFSVRCSNSRLARRQ